MTTLPDLLYVALFAVAFPLWDYLVFWPAFHRQSQADPALARTRLWKMTIGYAWALAGAARGLGKRRRGGRALGSGFTAEAPV